MSSRRHRITHRSTMRYEGEVVASHNELRMTPLTDAGQTTLEARIRIRPHSWSNVYTDHWGTSVMAVESQGAHEVLEIEAISTVERTEMVAEASASGWDSLAEPGICDRLSELLAPTPRTQASPDLAEIARAARDEPTPRAAAQAISAKVHERMRYSEGATQVSSTAEDAWSTGQGVCQDFAHVTLAALRSIGVPARYVSGYVARQPDLQRGQSCPGDSHAWIEIWDGAWLPYDPTHLAPVGLDHVVVGRGRDYDDVAPFRGMYAGPELADLDVEITFTRVS
ncbi:transglutaminase [Janibacter melonis]|uniref:Transglutaminase n=1 Tax=Janibacter melonis TaxID=262209 RepID=A0A176QE09_9MICO|nr:transglutaminase family protein [Janibacter melonis]OAB88009.1 transglutaminase [Janibacter melonis]